MMPKRAWAVLWGCAALLACSGCPRGAVIGAERAVVVEGVELTFEPGDRGDLALELGVTNPGLPSGELTELQWEVWLGNRWFAAGAQRLSQPVPAAGAQRLKVQLPIVFHRLVPAIEEPRALEVGVRGVLTLQADGAVQRLPFQDRRTVTARNAPAWVGPQDEL